MKGEVLKLKCCGAVIAFWGEKVIDTLEWRDIFDKYRTGSVIKEPFEGDWPTIETCKCRQQRCISSCIDRDFHYYAQLNRMR